MNIRISKHWKQLILTAAAVLWTGCDNDTSINEPIKISQEPLQESQQSSSSNASESNVNNASYSSGAETIDAASSSSQATSSSSQEQASSSSNLSWQILPLYGAVFDGDTATIDTPVIEDTLSPVVEDTLSPVVEDTIPKNAMKEAVVAEVGQKVAVDGDSCEVVSTYSNWFGFNTGETEAREKAKEEIQEKMDQLANDPSTSESKLACLQDVVTSITMGACIYGSLPENYPKEIKCSDGVVKETDHYKEKYQKYLTGLETNYKNIMEAFNKGVEECE